MTNLDSILKSTDITLPTKVHLVEAMVFPVVMYGYESWSIKPHSSHSLSGQHPEPEDPLAPFSAMPTAQRAPQEAKASVFCLLQRKNTFLAKVSRHLPKALVASARALPQGILARLLGASSGCLSIPANRCSDG